MMKLKIASVDRDASIDVGVQSTRTIPTNSESSSDFLCGDSSEYTSDARLRDCD
jgi:hypothetical protein